MVIKNSEPDNLILNGRAALCAGRDDMTSEDEEAEEQEERDKKLKNGSAHKFEKPERFARVLKSGVIPDAAMIHAARKTRQRAREQGIKQSQQRDITNKWLCIKSSGDFIPVEDPPEEQPSSNVSGSALSIMIKENKGSRLVREDGEDDGTDEEERVDMSAVTGVKELEDRREKFYSVQQESRYSLI